LHIFQLKLIFAVHLRLFSVFCPFPYEDVQRFGVSAAGGRRYRGHVLSGSSLHMQQFIAILIKRFYYILRNWKGMFSQILLPAMFVSVAMTVALTAPQVQDLPAIVLSPAQYYNYTQPRGNFIPVSVVPKSSDSSWSKDASASEIAATFHLASGISSTCVLKSPFNSSFDADVLRAVNFTSQSQRLLEMYFNSGCGSVFVKGISMMNFVPPATVVIQPSPVKNDSVSDEFGELLNCFGQINTHINVLYLKIYF